ncbi:response regulator transcription factor [Helicobacter muridarum]|uniref:Response regulator transcription factor n=1 Tax=Helicobacter muridarum TaxID=216 RepID=A0A099U189_9HELI|nr:response regulator transcription factor [Helicobacter muridarum]TLE00774.1 response regulator transcription factor [Helicobacter muridarum]STQ86544.1 two-component response regulator [Helicobacter muridarum]
MRKILLIEDDVELQNLLRTYLSQAMFEVVCFTFPSKALKMLEKENIDLIVLDLCLPEMDGFEVCQKIRSITQSPIIISSGRVDICSKINGFDNGADDYIAKPYEPAELIARINALLRRLKPIEMVFGGLNIDVKRRAVKIQGTIIDLTNTEFDILVFLIENRMQPISRDRIANAINAIHEDAKLRSIDTHIRNLRNKLGDSAKQPKYIQSVWGIGYKFCL